METKSSQIQVGRKVYCALYGGKVGTIVQVYGQPGVEPVKFFMNGAGVSGGSADVDVVWNDGSMSRKVPEGIVQCIQWKILDEVVDAEAVAGEIAKAEIFKIQAQIKADAEKLAKQNADLAARAEGVAMGLIPEDDFRAAKKRGSAAAYNLRLELKLAGIKARVTQDGYNAIRVRVAREDLDAAREIRCKYVAGSFDGQTDSYDYNSSAWGRVFGDVQYIFVDVE